ncbi:MAG TPA: 4-hydroxy-tetrahydrodipicolinate reductase [Planctomycetota bacterium]|jgi:4-hydroxy-tetrahydrodipicolinate reductase|nr:4-hydroxy-tetrahydrodipicolinate reductase [Planctomycetota bacterium]
MSTPVAIVGPDGRMGSFACRVLADAPGFTLVAEIRRGDNLADVLRKSGARVALDVTRAGLGFEHAAAMLASGVRPLVGTSGVTPAENAHLDAMARELGLGGLVVPNFSLGMWLLQRAAVEAARHYERAEIVEMHHEKKKDAPSGTALDTAERMRAAREDTAREIPIHSIRLPGLYAHQLVILGSAGETYTLRHDMSGPEAFGPGILRGLRYVAGAVGVGRGIDLAFGAAGR